MTHSPEPWRTDVWLDGPVQIVDKDGTAVCGYDREVGGPVYAIQCSVRDLERIVACVNACKGIPTDMLTTHAATIHISTTDAYNGEQLFFMSGKEEEITKHCKTWLRNHSTPRRETVTEKLSDTFKELWNATPPAPDEEPTNPELLAQLQELWKKPDWERIVACVNFLQGIPTDFLIKHMERPDTKRFGALNYLVGLNRWTEQTRRSAPAP